MGDERSERTRRFLTDRGGSRKETSLPEGPHRYRLFGAGLGGPSNLHETAWPMGGISHLCMAGR